jgi:hypothetical protein
MIFDTSDLNKKDQAIKYFEKLIEGKKRFELKILHPKRSLPQNAYLHSLFSIYGLFFGYSTEEVKTDIKIDLGYVYTKNGRDYLKHTSDMTTKELTDFIEKFRNLSAMRGKYLPAPHELSDDDLNEIARNQQYLTGRFDND